MAELVKDCGARVWPVRDGWIWTPEGLLLMTNDGELTRRLLHPGEEVEKTYHVWVYGPVDGAAKRLAAVTDLRGEVHASGPGGNAAAHHPDGRAGC